MRDVRRPIGVVNATSGAVSGEVRSLLDVPLGWKARQALFDSSLIATFPSCHKIIRVPANRRVSKRQVLRIIGADRKTTNFISLTPYHAAREIIYEDLIKRKHQSEPDASSRWRGKELPTAKLRGPKQALKQMSG